MKRFLRSAINWSGKHWRGIVSAIIIVALAVVTLSTQLNSLVPGQNRFETITLESINTAPQPWHRAVNAPYLVPAYLLGKVLNNPLYGARLTSVIFSLAAVACFFFLVKLWFNARIATVGSLLFLTSSWLLQISHQAVPFILMVFSLLAVFTPLAWFLRNKKHKNLAFVLFAAGLALAVYVPYMPWVVAIILVALIIKEKEALFKLNTWVIIVSAIVYFVILSPLFISFTTHPGQAKELLGFPLMWPTLGQYFSNLYHSVLMISIISKPLPELHLGDLPLLDVFSSAMLALGLYYYFKRLPKRRSLIILSCLAALILIISFSADYQLWIVALLPLIFMCIIAGIVELLNQWFSYFPRNPVARNIGVAIVVVAIGFTSFYHLQRHFIAWPNSPETKAAYVVKSK
jgi:hypothetical protein